MIPAAREGIACHDLKSSRSSSARKYYVLALMTSVYMLNLVDRSLMGLLLQPIKEDLHLSDTQLGLVTGIAFALFYATLGLPIARWADRGNRVTITSLAIGLWALTVMLSLFIANFAQLVMARVAAAVGEAGCKPPTYSLVGDYFPNPGERARAMAIYISGNSMSSLFSFIVGGWLSTLYGWRMTFFIMGVPGLILAILVKSTIREPRVQTALAKDRPRQPPMRAVFAMLWQQRSSRHLCIALILLYTMSSGLSPWYAAFLTRSHHMPTVEIGLWLGVISGLSGIVGVLLGGFVVGRWFETDSRGQMRLSAATIVLVLPCYLAFLLLPDRHQAISAMIPLMLFFSFFLGPTYALMQRLVPDAMRATMLALIMLLANLIGMGIGPLVVGILSDLLTPKLGGEALRYAMLSMTFIAPWAAWHFWLTGRTVQQDLALVTR